MINLVGKKQLSVKDRKYLEILLIKSKGALTPGERGHLIARRGYLTTEALDKFGIKLKKGDEVNEAKRGANDGDGNSASNEGSDNTGNDGAGDGGNNGSEGTDNSAGSEGNGNDGAGDEAGKYDELKSKELKKECKKREIEFAGNASNQALIELLEADDRGELEEV